MKTYIGTSFLAFLMLAACGAVAANAGGARAPQELLKRGEKLEKDGNFSEAFDVYAKLLRADDTPEPALSRSLGQATHCLKRLNRVVESDALRDEAVKRHSGKWLLLMAAARDIFGNQHSGFKIDGTFKRGHHRGGGEYMSCFERDRVQALRWLHQADGLMPADTDIETICAAIQDQLIIALTEEEIFYPAYNINTISKPTRKRS